MQSALYALVVACAPTVAPDTMMRLVEVESGRDPLALNANRPEGPVRLRAADRNEAIALAAREIAAGHTVDVGLAQINSTNFGALGRALDELFDPCTNIAAGAQILTENYQRARAQHHDDQAALQVALSLYNTGSNRAGFTNGYVARFYPARRRTASTPSFLAALDAALTATE